MLSSRSPSPPSIPVSFWACVLAVLALAAALPRPSTGQDFDASWYDPDAPYVKIAVVEDGVYQVTGSDVESALPSGTSLSDLSPASLRLFENGSEVPLQLDDDGDGAFDASDAFRFVGRRNRGTDELWAYEEPSDQSSPYHSLYADTTYYWLTWGGETGRRYDAPSPTPTTPTSRLRDLAHVEQENRYYYGRSFESGDSFYTRSEGYYWDRYSLTSVGSTSEEYTLPTGRRTSSASASLDLSVRLDAETSSCHRVEVAARLQQSDGSAAFEPVASTEWRGFERQTLQASIAQDRLPSGDLRVRITSFNEGFASANCPDPSSTPNFVLLDYLEAEYQRRLAAERNAQQFVVPSTTTSTFALSGYSGTDRVLVYNDADAHRYSAPVANGEATVTVEPSASNTSFWAVAPSALKSPAAVEPDASSRLAAPSNGADYVILTTEALRPSAQRLADYRQAQNGYAVKIVTVQNVFDQFDYGRPTPIAIRRFTRATRDWSPAPQFLTIVADAEFPVDPDPPSPRPSWNVPSFGYSPSDGWYAMQLDGPGDFSEFLAVGRIPVRTNAQGNLFVDKLRTYENAEPAAWQKRMLLLAGGTSESEQNSLQFYSNRWGELATGTPDTLYSAGMDTLRYYKQVDDALDTSFQDSLAADLERGAGWLNYFGHSAAQTWEIVTDPPQEFGNAGRLPVVLSLGCKTGSFAGDQFAERGVPSLGEQIVVGSVNEDGQPVAGSENGGIAHWGTSALGNRFPSARLGDALTTRVFTDTMRVLGEAIREAKAEIARNNGSSSVYQRHLLTYGLLGDPATRIALPDKPELSVTTQDIRLTPTRPTPSQPLTVDLTVNNYGLVPSDSVDASLQWVQPDGSQIRRDVRVPRFARQTTTSFQFDLDNRAIGSNQFRLTADPDNTYTEVDETNNTATREQVIFDTGLLLVTPTDGDVVDTPSPTLRMNLLTLSGTASTIEIQVDTLASFDSPALQRTTLQTGNFVVDWTPPQQLEDGQTYFWRARLGSSDAGNQWRQGQFSVETAASRPTWRQSGRLFPLNEQTRLTWNDRWSFTDFDVSVRAISDRPGATNGPFGFVVNTTQRFLRLSLGFGVMVLDDASGRVKAVQTFPTYDLSDNLEGEVGDQQEAVDSLRAFLDTNVETGDYVFVRTRHFGRQDGPAISAEVKDLFRNLGSSSAVSQPHSAAIDTLTYNHLWAMKARKGTPSATEEIVSPPSESDDVQGIVQETFTPFSHASGRTLTQRIGPAQSWDEVQWTAGTSGGDEIRIDVLAVQDSSVLATTSATASGAQSLAAIDAGEHPYLRLRATLSDSTDRTVPQLQALSASFTPTPETAINPSAFAALPDTVQQGEPLSPEIEVRHLDGPGASGLRLTTTLTDASNQTTQLRVDTLGTLAPGASSTVAFDVSTDNREGSNTLSFSAAGNESPERLASNNTALYTFFVQSDQSPPTLEVFADGRELVPVDPESDLQNPKIPYVPTQPSFEIRVRDENPYLRLSDTSYVEVYLKEGLPSDNPDVISDYRRVPFAGSQLTFNPPGEDADANRAEILFEPDLPPEDNTYTLKVEAQDVEGNKVDPYEVTFRVQQDQVIEDLYPYPNPMSEHTRFAFRIRGGNSRPTDFSLRIYTLSGRLVREFEGTEVNDGAGLRTTGWNFLTWNGRDADGDRVATGVYLYRVRMDGEDGTFEGDVEKIAVIR